ncbi:hypothetical protein [Pollutibacter soli]|uniref:hypothetical protein n=1 Tax=Pollutibacter soli TaxID=3034157 RepID=UPI003013D17B
MKKNPIILNCLFFLLSFSLTARDSGQDISFDFYGSPVKFSASNSFKEPLSNPATQSELEAFLKKLSQPGFEACINALMNYKKEQEPDDWLFYQLVRKTAASLSPKSENYHRYTAFKYFLMLKSGYDVKLFLKNEKLMFYVQCDENIYNIPFRIENGKQYVCLNFHDYPNSIPGTETFTGINLLAAPSVHGFSYKITKLPSFPATDYVEKEISFTYYQDDNHFKVKLNPQVRNIFANYPVVDYSNYFNIPLSNETYQSLIPALKKQVQGMNHKNGVDYLMRFTRYAFLFETDTKNFGSEKRLTPEQTLLYDKSDCEDRVALFFYLVKEVYHLPMIVLSYPQHITIAVQLEKPVGRTITYNGSRYSVCEPTPQKEDLAIGQWIPGLQKQPFEIVYAYQPVTR